MVDRELLISQALEQADVSPSEVAELVQDGSIFFRLLGKLVRHEKELQIGLLRQDLVTEEGRLKAIQEQGKMVGRASLVEWLFDLVIEGASENAGPGTE